MWSADKVEQFVKRYVKIDGKPANLLDWQVNRLIKPLYTNPRTIKRVLMFLPKKSGKSQIVSVLLLVGMLEKPGANVACIASTVAQAKIVFDGACKIISQSKELRARFWVREHVNKIIDKKTGSNCVVFSGSPKGRAGPNLDLLLCDEISDFTATNARGVYDQLAFSTMAKPNSIQMYFSTCGFQVEGHLWHTLFEEAKSLQKNPELDSKTLGIVYSLDPEKDWRNPDNWWDILPSCPAIVPRDFYLDQYEKLKVDTMGESRFRVLLLNQPCGFVGGDCWIDKTTWDKCKFEGIKESDLYGLPCYGALDMSRRFDLSAWVLLVEKDNRIFLLPRFFVCEAELEAKSKSDGFPYNLHAKNPEENIIVNPGTTIDPSYVRKQILLDSERFRMKSIGYDPAWLSDETRIILAEQHGINMIEVKQNYKVMSPPTLQLERWIRTRKIAHLGNHTMGFCVENTRLRHDGGLAMIDSKRSRARVDGCQAAAVAVQRYLDRSLGGFEAI